MKHITWYYRSKTIKIKQLTHYNQAYNNHDVTNIK